MPRKGILDTPEASRLKKATVLGISEPKLVENGPRAENVGNFASSERKIGSELGGKRLGSIVQGKIDSDLQKKSLGQMSRKLAQVTMFWGHLLEIWVLLPLVRGKVTRVSEKKVGANCAQVLPRRSMPRFGLGRRKFGDCCLQGWE